MTKVAVRYSGQLIGRAESVTVDADNMQIVVYEKGKKPRSVFTGKSFNLKNFKKKKNWDDDDSRKLFGARGYRKFKKHFSAP